MSNPVSRSPETLDKEAALPAVVPVIGKGLLSALYIYWAIQSGKQLVTKNIPGVYQGVRDNDWKKAFGQTMHGLVNAAFMIPGTGSIKTVRNLPRMWRIAKLSKANPIKAATLARQLTLAGRGTKVSKQVALQQLVEKPSLAGRTPGVRSGLRRIGTQQDKMTAFDTAFDKNVFGRIPGYNRWFGKNPAGKPNSILGYTRVNLPLYMGTAVGAEMLSPTAVGTPGAMAKGMAVSAAQQSGGPGGRAGAGAVKALPYAAYMRGLRDTSANAPIGGSTPQGAVY